ncbi:hypothetical protein [Streptomyces bluensis]|uniref:Uncharacterized protein n=1 Tax=Streptomyces bluensis TaxID=33897 RepID=A0ABW6UKX1_9ACTN
MTVRMQGRDDHSTPPNPGASSDDPGTRTDAQAAAEESGLAMVTIPQDELSRRFAREKDQGRRAGVRDLVGQLGFESAKALTEYIESQRHAEQQQKDVEQARLSEVERREQAAAERERQAQKRESTAAEREREAARRAVLVGLGATVANLEDAVVLLAREIEPEADEATLTQSAEELKQRRPELFGVRTPQAPAPPPSGISSNVPSRSGNTPPRPGQFGLDIARRRGHLKSS